MTVPHEIQPTTEDLDATIERLTAAADRGDEGARIELGRLCELLGRPTDALAHYQRVDLDPVALRLRWLMHARAGQAQLAEAQRELAAKGGDEFAGRSEHRCLSRRRAALIFRAASQQWYDAMLRQYRRPAEAGDPRAMRILGEIAEGRGDTGTAAGWFDRAAAAGEPLAIVRAATVRRPASARSGVLLVLAGIVAMAIGGWLALPDPDPTGVVRGSGSGYAGDMWGDELAGWLLVIGGLAAAGGGTGLARSGRS